MKYITCIVLLAWALAAPMPTHGKDFMQNSYRMTARLTELGERLSVEVLQSENGMIGPFWIITPPETRYFDGEGREIPRDALRIGDLLEITFGGQIMLSYPPQTVAGQIRLLQGARGGKSG